MHTSALGPFTVSRLTLGTGRLASSGSGRSISAVARLLDTATDLGINLIDTADSYASGECERLLGRALVGRRDKFIIWRDILFVPTLGLEQQAHPSSSSSYTEQEGAKILGQPEFVGH